MANLYKYENYIDQIFTTETCITETWDHVKWRHLCSQLNPVAVRPKLLMSARKDLKWTHIYKVFFYVSQRVIANLYKSRINCDSLLGLVWSAELFEDAQMRRVGSKLKVDVCRSSPSVQLRRQLHLQTPVKLLSGSRPCKVGSTRSH